MTKKQIDYIENHTIRNESLEEEILKLIDESHLYTRKEKLAFRHFCKAYSNLQRLVSILASKYIERETNEK